MSIAPVVASVSVTAPPARAFGLFTSGMERWWPVGKTIGQKPHVRIVLEPRPGGRWFEVDADGAETPWGEVMEWDPPGRVLLAWKLDRDFRFDADLTTEVEITFSPEGAGTRVRLEHRNLDRFGSDAARIAGLLGGGWPTILADYVQSAEAEAATVRTAEAQSAQS